MKKTIGIIIGVLILVGVLGYQQYEIINLSNQKLDKVIQLKDKDGKLMPMNVEEFVAYIINLIIQGQQKNNTPTN